MSKPKLFVVATPIGNIEDISLRAKKILSEVAVIFAEDTRELKKLVQLLGISIKAEVFSYANHNLKSATEHAMKKMLQGHDIAIVSDRGTPGICDPGAQMVAEAFALGFKVFPIPGACALATLYSVSGEASSEFYFGGFLPQGNKEREIWFSKVHALECPILFYEAPHRIKDSLGWLWKKDPLGRCFLGREMTKMFESYEWHESLETIQETRGEFVVLWKFGASQVSAADPLKTAEHWMKLRTCGDKQWSKWVSEQTGVNSKELYNALQKVKKDDPGL